MRPGQAQRIQLAIEGAAETAASGLLAAAGASPVVDGSLSLGARAILGGVVLYLLAISFIHWVNRGSLDDRALFARLGTVAGLILLVMLGSFLSPLAFTALVALALLTLATFETLSVDPSGEPSAG